MRTTQNLTKLNIETPFQRNTTKQNRKKKKDTK